MYALLKLGSMQIVKIKNYAVTMAYASSWVNTGVLLNAFNSEFYYFIILSFKIK
jgi:hypothetical protein